MQWWALGGLCAILLATACAGTGGKPLKAASVDAPVRAGIEQVTMMVGDGGDARTFACDAVLKFDPPRCSRMFEVRGVDWSALPVASAAADGQRVSEPVDLRGRYDGCVLTVEEAKRSAARRSLVVPRFEGPKSFLDESTAFKVAGAIEPRPPICNGDVLRLLGWGASGRSVDIEVAWADSALVEELRRQYGPVTVVSRLSPL